MFTSRPSDSWRESHRKGDAIPFLSEVFFEILEIGKPGRPNTKSRSHEDPLSLMTLCLGVNMPKNSAPDGDLWGVCDGAVSARCCVNPLLVT
jgi:hypothetical protein